MENTKLCTYALLTSSEYGLIVKLIIYDRKIILKIATIFDQG